MRRPRLVVTLAIVAAAVGVGGALVGGGDDGDEVLVSDPVASSTTSTRPATTTTTPAPPTTASIPSDPAAALAGVAVEREHAAGYDRDLFASWIDADGDGCDTRDDVLAAEQLDAGRGRGRGTCGTDGGTWWSPYDDLSTGEVGALEIDHLVPLKEAWDSGAWAWTAEHRAAFATDVTHAEVLVVVTAGANRAKGDKDPSNWMPPRRASWCAYAADWVRVKVVWGLSMDESEAGRLRNVLAACPDPTTTLVGARPAPPPLPATTAAATTAAATTAPAPPPAADPTSGCHPSYDPCVAYAADVDCAGGRGDGPAFTGRVDVIGPDVYGLDGDGDGIGCESSASG